MISNITTLEARVGSRLLSMSRTFDDKTDWISRKLGVPTASWSSGKAGMEHESWTTASQTESSLSSMDYRDRYWDDDDDASDFSFHDEDSGEFIPPIEEVECKLYKDGSSGPVGSVPITRSRSKKAHNKSAEAKEEPPVKETKERPPVNKTPKETAYDRYAVPKASIAPKVTNTKARHASSRPPQLPANRRRKPRTATSKKNGEQVKRRESPKGTTQIIKAKKYESGKRRESPRADTQITREQKKHETNKSVNRPNLSHLEKALGSDGPKDAAPEKKKASRILALSILFQGRQKKKSMATAKIKDDKTTVAKSPAIEDDSNHTSVSSTSMPKKERAPVTIDTCKSSEVEAVLEIEKNGNDAKKASPDEKNPESSSDIVTNSDGSGCLIRVDTLTE